MGKEPRTKSQEPRAKMQDNRCQCLNNVDGFWFTSFSYCLFHADFRRVMR